MKKWLVASYLLWLVGVGFANVRTYVHPETQEEAIVKIEYIGTNDDNEWEKLSYSKMKTDLLPVAESYFEEQSSNVTELVEELFGEMFEGCPSVFRHETEDYEIKKLSKADSWFCWKALSNYELYDDETYSIVITRKEVSRPNVLRGRTETYVKCKGYANYSFFLVKIEEQGKSFRWKGLGVSNDFHYKVN